MTTTDVQLWPDDMRKAMATLALAADVPCDLDCVVESIRQALEHRAAEYVLGLIQSFSGGLGAQFSNRKMAEMYRESAAQWQAQEEQLRANNEWRTVE